MFTNGTNFPVFLRFYKTIAPTVLKFYMEHDLPPGSQNYKMGSGRISKMAAITKNSKKKINFFFRTARYFWLNFVMVYQWKISIKSHSLRASKSGGNRKNRFS